MAEKMQRDPAVFVIVALVVVGAVAGLDLVSTAAEGQGFSVSPCSDYARVRTSYDQSNNTLTTTAFLISPGTTAEVCIAYALKGTAAVTPSTGPLACGHSRAANGSVAEDCTGQLAVVASAPILNQGGANVTMVYVLRASENASGVFWFWVDCGEFFPLAVGALPSSLTFPIIPGCVYEPNAPSRGSVTGISGMGVATVRVD